MLAASQRRGWSSSLTALIRTQAWLGIPISTSRHRAARCGAPSAKLIAQKRPTGIAPDPDCYARFVRAAVNYLGERVNACSLWNEPNLRTFLRPPDALDDRLVVPANLYRSLYVHGWDAIRESNNPDAKVMIGELSYLRAPGRFTAGGPKERDGVTAHEFLEQVARPGAGPLETDGVAFHPYQHTAGPLKRGPKFEVGIGKGKQTQELLERLFNNEARCSSRLFVRHEDGRCELPGLLYTEFGYLARHPDFPKRVQTEARRARLFPSALRKALGDRAKWMSIYVATEAPPLPLREDFGVFGVDGSVRGDREDGQARRAYCDGIRAFAIENDYIVGDPSAPC